ncbi:septum formation inhibitor Maf [Winogradskyella ludwigii]|uniref:septum formation inhibitor Maf n=1 Tax=Winogradskyella ludwigii TaxID=2686076 RepID=UPI0015CB8D94|nr:septum formation inhibitor Maf [Winogradskyella ludwigii]
MIRQFKSTVILAIGIVSLSVLNSCAKNTEKAPETLALSESKPEVIAPKKALSQEFKDYWYNGDAEITTYKLEQARYGEIREGKAVLVFVTEDFLPDAQVKADNYNQTNIPVLKVNATKNFNTGIYPYSIMQSTFYPVADNQNALKISISVQEWCGQTYMQLNNREDFEIQSHSYFQGQADQEFKIEKGLTENELWAKLRINPKRLPVGQLDIIPAIEHIRLNHEEFKPLKAFASLESNSYTLSYEDSNRTLKINFNPEFPYNILGWEETTTSGYGDSKKTLTTKATKLESIKSDYWNKKSIADESLRETLKLQ